MSLLHESAAASCAASNSRQPSILHGTNATSLTGNPEFTFPPTSVWIPDLPGHIGLLPNVNDEFNELILSRD